MAEFKFYPPAVSRIDQIYDYTFDQWGEEQAEKYVRGYIYTSKSSRIES